MPRDTGDVRVDGRELIRHLPHVRCARPSRPLGLFLLASPFPPRSPAHALFSLAPHVVPVCSSCPICLSYRYTSSCFAGDTFCPPASSGFSQKWPSSSTSSLKHGYHFYYQKATIGFFDTKPPESNTSPFTIANAASRTNPSGKVDCARRPSTVSGKGIQSTTIQSFARGGNALGLSDSGARLACQPDEGQFRGNANADLPVHVPIC
jgi:hypothetical protein